MLYAGSFSKILFPSLRIAYLVLPPHLVQPFVTAQQAFLDVAMVVALISFVGTVAYARYIERERS